MIANSDVHVWRTLEKIENLLYLPTDNKILKEKKTMQQGYDWVRENLTIIPEKTKTISIGCFIPSEFSEAYNKPQPK